MVVNFGTQQLQQTVVVNRGVVLGDVQLADIETRAAGPQEVLDATGGVVDAAAWPAGVRVSDEVAFVKRAEVVMEGVVDDTVAVGRRFNQADFGLGDDFPAVGTGSVGTGAQLGLED